MDAMDIYKKAWFAPLLCGKFVDPIFGKRITISSRLVGRGRHKCGAVFGAALLVAGAMACSVQAQTSAQSQSESIWRASSRLGYGPSPSLVADVSRVGGARAWSLQQLDLAYNASRKPAAIPAQFTHFNQTLEQIFPVFEAERKARKAGQERLQKKEDGEPGAGKMEAPMFSRDAAREAAAWRVTACSSPALENPLLARMTEFWFNHLNVFSGKGPVRPFVGHYELNVIRANALGKFEDLLLASAKHPAMLFYLDQAQSVADGSTGPLGQAHGLNENYARELMELHTLGVNGGYSQSDVRELARILTGWTVAPRQASGFRFAQQNHDTGDKRLLGTTFHNQGLKEGEDAIRMLARHPATAQRIATRLATFFVSDKPSQALIDRLASSFTASQGDMRVVMRTLIESTAFWQADQTLFKTPFDFACSALLALGGPQERRDMAQTLNFLNNAGQPVQGWQTPDGYKTDAATWLSPEALTRRADFAMTLAKQAPEPEFLSPFLGSVTRQRIGQEPTRLRTGLMLASPDFMRK
jgi:uncharacterized protein (DUF1800 family)